MAYSYQLQYMPGKAIGHADALSCCPLPLAIHAPAPAASILFVDELPSLVTASDIQTQSATDPVLSKVMDWMRRGWPQPQVATDFLPYYRGQHELSVQRGCLLWGNRVVVPPNLRSRIFSCLHKAHPGIVRMKALGCSYVWWLNIDQDIEEQVAHPPSGPSPGVGDT